MATAEAKHPGVIRVPGSLLGVPGTVIARPLTSDGQIWTPEAIYLTESRCEVGPDGVLRGDGLKVPVVPGVLWRVLFRPTGEGLPQRAGNDHVLLQAADLSTDGQPLQDIGETEIVAYTPAVRDDLSALVVEAQAAVADAEAVVTEAQALLDAGIGPEAVASTWGFVLKAQPTAPTVTTEYGVPVWWLDTSQALDPVPVNPPPPTWNDTNSTFVVPANVVGVDYVWTSGGGGVAGTVLTQGSTQTTSGTFPRAVTVTARARDGYVLMSSYTWAHSFPDPAANVLLATDSFAGADTASIMGRVMDNAAGGSGSVTWARIPYTAPGVYRDPLPHNVGLSGNRLLVTATNDTTEARGLMVAVGTKGMQLDFTTVSYSGQASDPEYAIEMRLGAGTAHTIEAGRCALSIGKGRWSAAVQDLGTQQTKLEATAGRWSIKLFGDTFTVVTPLGQTYTYPAGTAGKNGAETAIRVNASYSTTSVASVLIDDFAVRQLG